MGRSAKKSATKTEKVDAAVVAPPAKPLKKGKREPEDDVEKEPVSAKKKKLENQKAEVKIEKKVVEKKVDTSSDSQDGSSGFADSETPVAEKPAVSATDNVAAKEDEPSSNESGSEDDNSEENDVTIQKDPAAASKEDSKDDGGDGSPEDSEGAAPEDDKKESSEKDEEPSNNPEKNESDVEMTDNASVKADDEVPDKTENKDESNLHKTLFVGNLSFSVEKPDVENFFKDVGEVVEVRFAIHRDNTFRGFGHVVFATAEQAEKALLELNGTDLLGRPVRLDMARERGADTPHDNGGKDNEQSQKGGRAHTVFVRGFDKNAGQDQIKSLLEKNFGSCGEITRISVPKDQEGGLKGIAYIEFSDSEAYNKALESNGFDFGEGSLTVEEAKPMSNRGGRFRGGRGGGRFGRGQGHGGGRGGRFGRGRGL